MIQPIKMCTRCKEELSVERFSTDRTRSDGHSKWCKSCVAENGKRHYRLNREKILASQAKWRSDNLELARSRARASDAKHRERKNAYNRARYRAKREEILSYSKAHHRKRRYGLTPEQFAELLDAQDGACAICRKVASSWHVDHDHSCCPTIYTCGRCIRGILCRNCNTGLGRFQDDVELLQLAIAYLRDQ